MATFAVLVLFEPSSQKVKRRAAVMSGEYLGLALIRESCSARRPRARAWGRRRCTFQFGAEGKIGVNHAGGAELDRGRFEARRGVSAAQSLSLLPCHRRGLSAKRHLLHPPLARANTGARARFAETIRSSVPLEFQSLHINSLHMRLVACAAWRYKMSPSSRISPLELFFCVWHHQRRRPLLPSTKLVPIAKHRPDSDDDDNDDNGRLRARYPRRAATLARSLTSRTVNITNNPDELIWTRVDHYAQGLGSEEEVNVTAVQYVTVSGRGRGPFGFLCCEGN